MGTERCGPNPPAGYDFLVCFEWVRRWGLGGGGGARAGAGGRFGGKALITRKIEGDKALRAGGL